MFVCAPRLETTPLRTSAMCAMILPHNMIKLAAIAAKPALPSHGGAGLLSKPEAGHALPELRAPRQDEPALLTLVCCRPNQSLRCLPPAAPTRPPSPSPCHGSKLVNYCSQECQLRGPPLPLPLSSCAEELSHTCDPRHPSLPAPLHLPSRRPRHRLEPKSTGALSCRCSAHAQTGRRGTSSAAVARVGAHRQSQRQCGRPSHPAPTWSGGFESMAAGPSRAPGWTTSATRVSSTVRRLASSAQGAPLPR